MIFITLSFSCIFELLPLLHGNGPVLLSYCIASYCMNVHYLFYSVLVDEYFCYFQSFFYHWDTVMILFNIYPGTNLLGIFLGTELLLQSYAFQISKELSSIMVQTIHPSNNQKSECLFSYILTDLFNMLTFANQAV